MPVDAGPSQLAVSPDGRTIAGGDWVGTVYVWDAVSRRRIATVPRGPDDGGNVLALSFSPDGRTLVVSRALAGDTSAEAPISFVDLRITPPTSTVALAGSGALMARFTPDGTGLITLFRDGTIGVVDVATGAVSRVADAPGWTPDLSPPTPPFVWHLPFVGARRPELQSSSGPGTECCGEFAP